MTKFTYFILIFCFVGFFAVAQSSDDVLLELDRTIAAEPVKKEISNFSWTKLTGDWGGARTDLEALSQREGGKPVGDL